MKDLAKELLALEKKFREAGLSERDTDRWQHLIDSLFGNQLANGRRTFRLPCDQPAVMQIGEDRFTCRVREISHFNLTLTASLFNDLLVGDGLTLESLEMKGRRVMLGLQARIARLRTFEGEPAAGVEVVPGEQSGANDIYFKEIYYPIYINFLESLA